MLPITSLDRIPDDPAELERYDRSVHTPIMRRIPEVHTARFGRVLEPADAGLARTTSSRTLPSTSELRSAWLASAEMTDGPGDVANVASGVVTITLCSDEDFPPLAP